MNGSWSLEIAVGADVIPLGGEVHFIGASAFGHRSVVKHLGEVVWCGLPGLGGDSGVRGEWPHRRRGRLSNVGF
jgi:hypothetical protein